MFPSSSPSIHLSFLSLDSCIFTSNFQTLLFIYSFQSLILEFATLSRLTGDPRFEQVASRAFFALWNRRSASGLLGNAISAGTGVSYPLPSSSLVPFINPLPAYLPRGSQTLTPSELVPGVDRSPRFSRRSWERLLPRNCSQGLHPSGRGGLS